MVLREEGFMVLREEGFMVLVYQTLKPLTPLTL
jgi:hypothetical protein